MKDHKSYLDRAASCEYKPYENKGLELRARPFLVEKLPKFPKRILIVGMALGGKEEVDSIKKYFPKYSRYGVDIAKSALNKDIDAKLVQSDLASLTFKNSFFSGIMCSAVMHEVYSYSINGEESVDQAFSEASRTLISGGLFAIREFYVPDEQQLKLKMLTKEARVFSKKFIKFFRKSYDSKMRSLFKQHRGYIYASHRLLYELMLHFRVAVECNSSMNDFFNSKEIEELYLPLSITDYFNYTLKYNLDIVGLEYIDFKKYYPPIERNFQIFDLENNLIKNKFGFVDIICRKK